MKPRSNRPAIAGALAGLASLVLAGCTAAAPTGPAETAPDELTGTISLWWSQVDREADVARTAIDDFLAANPGVTVEYHDGQDDDKIAKVIASGGDIDVAITSGPDSLGTFCSSGALVDLSGYMERDGVDMSLFSAAAKTYTAFDGVQCSLPWLNNAYGMYYNTDLLASVGATEPPKTYSELEDLALKLTTYNDDGSIKTLGFNPLIGFYESLPQQWAATIGASWMPDGVADFAGDPAWTELMTWQKSFIDKIGYEKLQAFTAGLGDEWSAEQAFLTGQVAMIIDGEWRVAFVEDLAPDLGFATAPMVTADDRTDLYGGGYVSGSLAGLAKGSSNPEAAWALIKYLTTDTGALVKLSNGLRNMPSTQASLSSPDLDLPDASMTFVGIVSSPNAQTTPPSIVGSADQTSLTGFWQEFQAGDGTGLADGLAKVDEDITNAISLSTGP
jgi:multiple sugar transport system substrate-binding protein